MKRIIAFLKKHTLWMGFLGVLIPLLLLLGLQYVWLSRLERVSAIAHQAALHNYLEAVGTEIQYFYRSTAEGVLNIPASLFHQERLDKVAMLWRNKLVPGAKRLFLVDFTRDITGNFLFFDGESQTLKTPPASDESMAIIIASLPWQLLNFGDGLTEYETLAVDERDAQFRIILKPIVDDGSFVVGIAGMILDQEYFQEKLLPSTIRKALPGFFPDDAQEELVVVVRDEKGEMVMGNWDEKEKARDAVTAGFPFVFTDWKLGIYSRGATPEQWARTSFLFNVTLSALLALFLMGAVLLALRSANRAMRLSEMKSDFVSNVSHELRTPLASIRVFAELLKLGRATTPEKTREYGEFIEGESHRLSRLIDNILDFSRIETEQKSYHFVPADLSEIVSSVLQTFEVRSKQSGFRIRFRGPDKPLPRVEVDPDAIAQAVHNLLDNALKYSGGSREVEVRISEKDDSVVISVLDQGIGIASEEQKKIFERFHRVGSSLVHDVKGNGLGLSIVHHIVRAHQGMVRVESEPGKGSCFSIHLPLDPKPGKKEAENRDRDSQQWDNQRSGRNVRAG